MLQPCSGATTEATEVGLTAPAPTDNIAEGGRVRHDTEFLLPADIQEKQRRAEEKVQQLSSTAATVRKRDFLSDTADAPVHSLDGTAFTIVSLDAVNALLALTKCKTCNGAVKIIKDEREYGLALKLHLVCANCDKTSSAWSSPRVGGDKISPFAVNILAARAMQATGNRQTALNDVFSVMNISHRGLHTKTWQAYVKTKLTPAATRAAQKVTSRHLRFASFTAN